MKIRSGVSGRNYTDPKPIDRTRYFDRAENRVNRSGFPDGEIIRVSARVPGTGTETEPARYYRTDRYIGYRGRGFADADFIPGAVRADRGY